MLYNINQQWAILTLAGWTKECTLSLMLLHLLLCLPCVLILELLVLLIVVMKLASHLIDGVLELCRNFLSLLLLLVSPLPALLLLGEGM